MIEIETQPAGVTRDPSTEQWYNSYGIALFRLGRFAEAVATYDAAITIRADYAGAYNNRGNALFCLGKHDAAIASYDRAIALKADFADAYYNRGTALLELRQYEAALASYDRAIALNFPYAYNNRGNALLALARPEAAIESYDRAILLHPQSVDAHYNRGNALTDLERYSEAVAAYDTAIALKPDHAGAHNNRGNALHALKQHAAAIDCYDRAIAIDPRHADAHNNRGNVLHELKQLVPALLSYDRTITARPDFVEAHSNRGNVLVDLGRFDEALAAFDHALTLDGGHVGAHYNKSLALLLRGDFESGWSEYEWRHKTEFAHARMANCGGRGTFWPTGEAIRGKTILLYAEQGLGDVLQFCRYAPMVSALGARVILEVPRTLLALLTHLPGVSQVVADAGTLPGVDFSYPLMSLPLAFATRLETIPSGDRYLRGDPVRIAQWRARLQGDGRPRVGLTWSGSETHRHDRHRSIALAELVRYLPDGFQYVSLQDKVRPTDAEALRASRILDVGDRLRDFADTAALCECMDLVISVDTSVAHLSGALGRRTWILLPFNPDWRWMLDRDDTPWYRTARLYRQETIGDWSGMLAKVAADMLDLGASP
jgi:tetratricopeptide (TPR) repeat protein